jgi:hypothetical protein
MFVVISVEIFGRKGAGICSFLASLSTLQEIEVPPRLPVVAI